MSNQQLYFAVGVPCAGYLFGFTGTILAMFWQARDLGRRIESLEVKLDLVIGK